MVLLSNKVQITLITFSISYLLAEFTNSFFFSSLTAFLLVFIVIQTFPKARKTNKRISFILFLLGSIFLIRTNSSYADWIKAISSNGGLVVLFIVLPFLSFPLYFENYEKCLRNFSLKHICSVTRFGNLSASLTYFLSALLNVGSFPIVYSLFDKTIEFREKDKTLWLSMMRGNTAAIFWSPNFVAVAVILHYLELPWISILPLGISLSILVMISNWLTLYMRVKKNNIKISEHIEDFKLSKDDKRGLLKLSGIFIVLISMIGFFNIFTSLKLLVIVPIVALIYPISLAIVQKKVKSYKKQLKVYFSHSLLGIKNEVLIFAAAGFFGKSLELTGIGKLIPSLLNLNNIHQPFLAIMAIMLFMGTLAIVGIHPVVTSTAIATSMTAGMLGLSLYGYAFTLLASYGLSVLVSPFSGMTLVMSGLTKHSSWELGPKMNIIYCVGMSLIFAILIPFIK